ncbi:hypothetical protein BH23ACT5_BH23ACT5_09860 [soil metagenome]
MNLKAAERRCRGCGTLIPAQPSGPGRPREFCSQPCRRSWHHDRERERERAAQAEVGERNRYARDLRYYGKRAADRLARARGAG